MIPLSPTLIGAAVAGVLILGLIAAVKVQSSRLESCKTEVEAGKVMIQSLGDQIKAQNDAVAALESAGKLARAKGANAVAKAQKEAQGLAGEAARLALLLKQAGGGGKSCAQGVQDAKAGLGP
jgi:hypothetical protein